MIRTSRGFTLIELIITVTIIGIVIAIAAPTYTDYLTNSRRTDATAALLKMADMQERYFIRNNSYATQASINDVGGAGTVGDYYTLDIVSASTSAYSLRATPKAGGPQAGDGDCPTITLNSAGARLPAGCW